MKNAIGSSINRVYANAKAFRRASVFALTVLAMGMAMPGAAYDLLHRWSFTDGSLDDSVGGVTATTIGSSTAVRVEDGGIRLGKENGTDYATSLNLGTGLVSSDTITIEIWGKQNGVSQNMRLIDWGDAGQTGLSPSAYTAMPWCNTSGDYTCFWFYGGGSTSSYLNNCFASGVKYHIAITAKVVDGTSTLRLIRRNVSSLGDVKTLDHTTTGVQWTKIQASNFYLAHSQWSSESGNDSNATYDEVRIYSGIVGEEQLAANAVLGPDVLAASAGTDSDVGFTIPAGATFTFPDGAYSDNNYAVSGTVTLGADAKIVFDTANAQSAAMTFSASAFSLPDGVSSILDMVELTNSETYEVSLSGTTITVASKNAATWTGAAGDGSWNNAGNWQDGVVPDEGTVVTIAGNAVNLNVPAGSSCPCASIEVLNCTVTADCDWRGLAVTPRLSAAVNLNGHTLSLGSLEAGLNAEFSNSAETDSEVRFYADGDTATAEESAFVTNLANLKMAENAKMVIMRTNEAAASGTLKIGLADKYTVFRTENGTISMNANGTLGFTAGSYSCLDIAGGTLDFGTADERGLSVGANGIVARSFMNISAGKLNTSWIDVGGASGSEVRVVQTGGEVATGARTNGNLWLGRWNGSEVTYEMSGGVINQGGSAYNKGSLQVNCEQSNGKATFNMTGGTINANVIDIGPKGTGVFTQDGGDIYIKNSDMRLGRLAGSSGTYTINDGLLSAKYWFIIGGAGTGKFVQNGGEMLFTGGDNADGNWVSIGGNSSGTGTYVMNDGLLEVGNSERGGGIFVGNYGTAVFEMNGGTVKAPAFYGRTRNGTLILNGGTIIATKDGDEENTKHCSNSGIIKNVGNLMFDGAVTLDTNGHNTKIEGCGYEARSGSALVKTGEGTLTVQAVPPVDMLTVSNGTLAVSANADNTASARLAHRWSFTGGSLEDSVGGVTATTIGSSSAVNAEDGGVRLGKENGSKYATSLNLGTSLLAGDEVTIEIWGTRNSSGQNMRLFDWGDAGLSGLSPSAYLAMPWGNDYDSSNYICIWFYGGGGTSSTLNNSFTVGEKYHIALTARVVDGTATMHFVRRNASTLEDVKTLDFTATGIQWEKIKAGRFFLAHSQWSSESGNDSNATYDEVRIWKGVLNDDAIALSAEKGPDATTDDFAAIIAKSGEASPVQRSLEIVSGAALEIASGTTLSQPIVKGDGTITGGTLNVTGKLVVRAGKTMIASGTVDLTDAAVELEDPENLTTSFVFLQAPNGGTLDVVGSPKAVGLPWGWKLAISENAARINKMGFTVYIR